MYRKELDGLRAFAVIAVLINHANTAWLPSGFLGVDCFFLLSGYVVSRSWGTRRREGAFHFYQRRLRRLQPALLSMVIAVVLLAHRLAVDRPWQHCTDLARWFEQPQPVKPKPRLFRQRRRKKPIHTYLEPRC